VLEKLNYLGFQEMVKLLVTKAKIEKTDRYKRTALTHATMNGSASVVSYLLARGADPNRADTSGRHFKV
jgi:ankyrin repeat protein